MKYAKISPEDDRERSTNINFDEVHQRFETWAAEHSWDGVEEDDIGITTQQSRNAAFRRGLQLLNLAFSSEHRPPRSGSS